MGPILEPIWELILGLILEPIGALGLQESPLKGAPINPLFAGVPQLWKSRQS